MIVLSQFKQHFRRTSGSYIKPAFFENFCHHFLPAKRVIPFPLAIWTCGFSLIYTCCCIPKTMMTSRLHHPLLTSACYYIPKPILAPRPFFPPPYLCHYSSSQTIDVYKLSFSQIPTIFKNAKLCSPRYSLYSLLFCYFPILSDLKR